jgi:hypothetical protein
VIWGRARELLSGDVSDRAEVETFTALRSILEGKAGLVLADLARLEAERQQVEAWLEGDRASKVVVVAVTDREKADKVFETLPFVDDVLARPVSPARLKRSLERALEAIANRRVIGQLERMVTRKAQEFEALRKIGVALSSERDIGKLLQQILTTSRAITGADAGGLYLVEREKMKGETHAERLRFQLAQNDSMPISFEASTFPLDDSSIAGYAARRGETINAPDVHAYDSRPDSPFRACLAFDQKSGYRTKSMLVVPMRNHQNEVMGIIQLINKKRDPVSVLVNLAMVEEEVIPFKSADEQVVASLASQAAVALLNATLIRHILSLEREEPFHPPDPTPS